MPNPVERHHQCFGSAGPWAWKSANDLACSAGVPDFSSVPLIHTIFAERTGIHVDVIDDSISDYLAIRGSMFSGVLFLGELTAVVT